MSTNKRQRTDFDQNYQQNYTRNNESSNGGGGGYSHKPQPSPVVHARNLAEGATEFDVKKSLERYGIVNTIIIMSKKRQALIEFNDITSAIACVNDASRTVLIISGQPAYMNYSNIQKITRMGDDERTDNNVLLFTIQNPLYPITVEVMHTICNSYGKILRIIIFRKAGVQSMVEFDSVEAANKAKEQLDGADIYAGCCTLKIEYAKPTRLNVPRNDQDNWDYTGGTSNQNNEESHQSNYSYNQRSSSTTTSSNTNNYKNDNDNNNKPYYNRNNSSNSSNSTYNNGSSTNNNGKPTFNRYNSESSNSNNANNGQNTSNSYNQGYQRNPTNNNGNNNQSNNQNNNGNRPNSNSIGNTKISSYGSSTNIKEIPSLMNSDSVLPLPPSFNTNNNAQNGAGNNAQILIMCGNICFERMNCDKLFNFFCLYGNVDRIKFLMTKEGSVMLQMNNAAPMYNVLSHLSNTYFYGRKLQIQITKQSVLNPVNRPSDLKDGTPSYKDYSLCRNNRFQTPEAALKNKPLAPANVLHWFNAPPDADVQGIIDIFVKLGAKPPAKCRIFPKKPEKCATGLAEWNNIAEAVEALLLANNHEISHPSSKFPYTFKLCFSATPVVD